MKTIELEVYADEIINEKFIINNFGTENYHNNIYNKFFRTAIHYGIDSFFSEFKKRDLH